MTKQYIELSKRILSEGVLVKNTRTGTSCLTTINADFVYDVGAGEYPLVTTRKAPTKLPVAELLGYLRGYTSAADFRAIGSRSWDMNANETKAWLDNPNRKGVDDLGKVYGAVAKDFGGIDLFKKVYNNLKNGIDDRGEIITYWKPDDFDKGCLRPCMHSFQFSLLDGVLYLNATQRSVDVPLGLVANMQQCYLFLAIMAQITGHKAGKVFHKMVNVHIYDNQIGLMEDQVKREIYPSTAKITINPMIQTLEDLQTWVTTDDFIVSDYESHHTIKYPFSA